MRELGEVRVDATAVTALQRTPDAQVQLEPRRGGDVLVEGLLHRAVREAVPAGSHRGIGEDTVHGGPPQRLDQLFARQVDDLLHDGELELRTEGRGDLQYLDGGRVEPAQPLADNLAHPVGQRDRALLDVGETVLDHQQPYYLVEEERVAPGGLVQPIDDPLGSRGPVAADQFGGLGDVQPAYRQVPGQAQDGADDLATLLVAANLGLPVCARDQHRSVGQPAGEELQHQQRGPVGPVQVVEQQHQQPVGRGVGQEAASSPATRVLPTPGSPESR